MKCLWYAVCALLCLTLCGPMNCSPPGSSVPGISQARILEWVAISFSSGSSQPRDRTCVSCVSCIVRWILYLWATWEAQNFWLRHTACGLLVPQAGIKELGVLTIEFELSPFHKLLFLCVQRVCPGIINLLSSLGRMWVLCHHCFIVLGRIACSCHMVLLLSKPAFSSDRWLTGVFIPFPLLMIL